VVTKERILYILALTCLAFVIITLMGGCKRPPAKAALAPPATVGCPAGYKPVSRHQGRSGVDRGHGFTIVHYTDHGKPMHLFCTQDDGVADPRISKPVSSSIPEPK
jgi:hypothetical protein